MSIIFPDTSESPWTHPDTGTIYEYIDGTWQPQDPSGGGSSGGGGGDSYLGLGGMVIAHHVFSLDYNNAGRVRTKGSQKHKIDMSMYDWTQYDKVLIGPYLEIVTAPDKRTILYRSMRHINTNSAGGPLSSHSVPTSPDGLSAEGNFLFTFYKASLWMMDMSNEEIVNTITSYLDDPASYKFKSPTTVNCL